MDIEQKIKNRLLTKGFSKEKLSNNRGLIGAAIDETIIEVIKNKDFRMSPIKNNFGIKYTWFCLTFTATLLGTIILLFINWFLILV